MEASTRQATTQAGSRLGQHRTHVRSMHARTCDLRTCKWARIACTTAPVEGPLRTQHDESRNGSTRTCGAVCLTFPLRHRLSDQWWVGPFRTPQTTASSLSSRQKYSRMEDTGALLNAAHDEADADGRAEEDDEEDP